MDLINPQIIEDIVKDTMAPMIGDFPVSVQIGDALKSTASKEEVQSMKIDLEKLKKDMERLITLVGDFSVSQQIDMAINRSEN